MKRASQLLIAGALCMASAPLWSAQLRASPYQDAFSERVSNPSDSTSLSNFITIAVESGQYDQALSTIEQHLISRPRDAHARLIAGRLYNHVGSYDLARRQIEYALAIGTLNSGDRAEAEKLLQRIDKGLSGNSGFVSLTIGGELVYLDFASTAAIGDRTDFNPYGEIYGTMRHSLDTPTDDSIVLTANARVSRRFGDVTLSGTGGIFTALSGRASITYDKGLPESGISSLRLGLTAYGHYSSFQKNAATREYGVLAKFSARPSVDTSLFATFGYANLSASDLLFTDHRLSAKIGGVHRINGKHAIGARIGAEFDYASGWKQVGKVIDGEISYAGLLWSKPDGPVWTHRLGLGGGYVELPDLTATPGTVFDGTFLQVSWDHAFEFDDHNRIDLTTYYQKFNLNSASRDHSKLGIGLSYTYTFR